jgi:hypothetical protein
MEPVKATFPGDKIIIPNNPQTEDTPKENEDLTLKQVTEREKLFDLTWHRMVWAWLKDWLEWNKIFLNEQAEKRRIMRACAEANLFCETDHKTYYVIVAPNGKYYARNRDGILMLKKRGIISESVSIVEILNDAVYIARWNPKRIGSKKK